MADRRAQWLKSIVDTGHLKPTTTPPLERYLMLEETGPVWAACLREAGWNATANPDGNGVTGDYGNEAQAGAYNLAEYNCQARFTLHPRLILMGSFPPELLRMGWEYNHDLVIPCLARHGLSVTEPLPSMETYVAQQGYWMGYPQVPPDRAVAVGKECPQQMPSKYLLGQA